MIHFVKTYFSFIWPHFCSFTFGQVKMTACYCVKMKLCDIIRWVKIQKRKKRKKKRKIGVEIAQLVECLTEKPGAILTWVRVPGAARDFSPRVNFQCRLSYKVTVSVHLCTRYKSPTQAATPLCGHDTKILHTLIEMGSTALTAAVPYPAKATWIS